MMLVQALTGDHNRSDFDCGRPELNDWLKSIARQHQHKGLSRTYVVTLAEEPARICGYYALTLAELENRHLPSEWQKKLPKRIPGVRLGRLAINSAQQGRGLGAMLLVDAMHRANRIYQEAGGIGLFVDAIDDPAAHFYRRFGFQPVPDQPLMLFLPASTLNTLPAAPA